MINTYKKHLDHFFEKLLYYRHISGRINKVLQKDVEKFSSDEARILFASALAICDWTGPNDNGWEINFYAGPIIETKKDDYEKEIEKISSKQLCLLYAQSFESFERFLKNCLFDKLNKDETFRQNAKSLFSQSQNSSLSRENMKGGEDLFKALKKAGGESYKIFSSHNNINIKFKELWTILSQARHSITHQESSIELSIVNQSNHHFEIFSRLFNSRNISEDLLLIELDYVKFDFLIKRFSEFAFQIFKLLSIEENLDWNYK